MFTFSVLSSIKVVFSSISLKTHQQYQVERHVIYNQTKRLQLHQQILLPFFSHLSKFGHVARTAPLEFIKGPSQWQHLITSDRHSAPPPQCCRVF